MILMKTNKFALGAVVPLLFCGVAFGQTPGAGPQGAVEIPDGRSSEVQIFGGLRTWAATWDLPVFTRLGVTSSANQPVIIKDVEQRINSTRIAPIPFLGVRYGNFIASASYLARTGFGSNGLLPSDVRRDELDLTLGYYVLPQLTLSVGYKTAKLDRISPVTDGGSKTDGILVGMSGSVPLDGSTRLSLYGNFAYGLGRAKFDVALPNGDTRSNAEYKIGEVGLSYRLFSAPQGALKQLSLSFGYRAQLFTLKSIPFGTYATSALVPTEVERRNVQSTTDGFVVGLIGVF